MAIASPLRGDLYCAASDASINAPAYPSGLVFSLVVKPMRLNGVLIRFVRNSTPWE